MRLTSRPQPSPLTDRRRRLIALALLWSLGPGCSAGNDLGGAWRVEKDAPLVGDKLVYDDTSDQRAVGIELLIGHYGTDIAGLLKFYDNEDFLSPRSATNPKGQCACTFIHNGRANAEHTHVEFDLKGCLPGSATAAQMLIRGELNLSADGRLEGRIKVVGDDPLWAGKTQQFTFLRTASVGAVDDTDLICETPDQDEGNIYNGL